MESGYTQVTETTLYSSGTGYGWTGITGLASRDRTLPDNLKRDFVAGTDSTFVVDLANGDYQITVIIGDQLYPRSLIDVYAEGTLVINDLASSAGTFQEITFYATVADTQLNINIKQDGGPTWVINSITITPGLPPTLPTDGSFDFGTSGSPVETGYTQVTETTQYTSEQGYGWTGITGLASRDRTLQDNLR